VNPDSKSETILMVIVMYSVACRLATIHLERLKRIIVAGDLHGDLDSCNQIEKLVGNEDLLIFLGDYGDRGPNSVEVIEGVQRLLQKYPGRVLALKGNHEDYSEDGEPRFSPCTLKEEAETKKGSWALYFQELKRNFLEKLSLAAIIPNRILFVHGGISTRIRSKEDLIKPDREIEEDIIWSDPSGEGKSPNPRGAGVSYGLEVSDKVTKRLGVTCIIRSHEPEKTFDGPTVEHEGRVVTLSSTRVYGGRPFVLILPKEDIPELKEMKRYTVYL